MRLSAIGLSLAIDLAVASTASAQAPQPLDESMLGEAGESCRARADCKQGLKCIDNVCVDPREGETCGATSDCGGWLRCIDKVCRRPGATPAPAPVPAPVAAPAPVPVPVPAPAPAPGSPEVGAPPPLEPTGRRWMDFTLDDEIHAYAGLTFAPGVFLGLDYGTGQTSPAYGSFFFALRGGVLFGRTALELEISPVTWIPILPAGGGAFNLNLSIGTYNQLVEGVYWPTRFGVGLQYLPNASQALFLSRLDLLGVAFNVGHVLIDFHVPSFRFTTEFDQIGTFNWLFGAGASYVF